MYAQLDSSVSHLETSAHIFYATDLGFLGHRVPLLAQLHIAGSRLWSRAPTFMTAEFLAFAMALGSCWA